MSNKKIILITGILILFILIFFSYYLIAIKPIINGEYIPNKKDCVKAYNCDCMKDTCLCNFKKLFWENRMSCKKSDISEKHINK